MPELPEVETVARALESKLVGQRVDRLRHQKGFAKVFATHSPAAARRFVEGQSITAVGRRGKYVLLWIESGVIAIHLRMTGQIVLGDVAASEAKYVTASFSCESGISFHLRDTRKFGRVYLFPDLAPLDEKLGCEPLSDGFTKGWFHKVLRQRRRLLKPLLLDQRIVCGIGNIYADEALFRAGLHPEALSSQVSTQKAERLWRAIRDVLQESIEAHGTTFLSFLYEDGRTGQYAERLLVFQRHGEPCLQCGAKIKKIRVGGRGTHYCPRCQRQPRSKKQ